MISVTAVYDCYVSRVLCQCRVDYRLLAMPGYRKMTVASLRDVCESRGLQCSGLRKSELIDLLCRDDDA